nr:hypothetical protein OH820_03520 [Streptomyces sp. NBC_00857]
MSEESRTRVQALLGDQRERVRAALSTTSAPETDSAELDGLAVFVVAVTQSLAVLSRAGTPDADLRSVARIACTTVADTLARAKSEGARPS